MCATRRGAHSALRRSGCARGELCERGWPRAAAILEAGRARGVPGLRAGPAALPVGGSGWRRRPGRGGELCRLRCGGGGNNSADRGARTAARGAGRGTMNEEEQFVNIDLNDDNICSVCKLGTDKETLSFCHVCFELNLEGVPKSNLLHTRSLRGHKDCFEKYHLIANQDCSRSKLSKSTYEGVKTLLTKKINWIVQYAQNKDMDLDSECSKNTRHHLFNFRHKPDKKLLPQFDYQVPKYSVKGIAGNTGDLSSYTQRILEQRENTDFGLAILQDSDALWPHKHNQAQKKEETSSGPEENVQTQHPHYSREELNSMTLDEVEQLNTKLQQQIQEVFEELTHQVQEKDSLASELHVRHVAIEQLLKNYSKLPCLQVGRAGTRSHLPINN